MRLQLAPLHQERRRRSSHTQARGYGYPMNPSIEPCDAAAAGSPLYSFRLVSSDDSATVGVATPTISFKAARVEPKHTQHVIRALAAALPLPANLSHVKRAKKTPDGMLVLLCVLEDYPTLAASVQGSVASYIMDACDVEVPGKPARSKAQYRRDQLIWPCSYLFQQPVPALTPGEERVARAHLEDAESEARRAEASGWPPVAAVIVDPTANRVVARAHSRTLRATADAGPCHVLHTAVMACIQAVAEAHLAAATAPGYDLATAPYLCTGLDLYTNLEPDAMDAMAMVHSRMRRVIYSAASERYGVLGSRALLQELPGLNHRYEVYRADPM